MKVWVLTEGEYSDYRIVAIFTDKEKALKLLDYKKKTINNFPELTEWETDVEPVPTPMWKGWDIWFKSNGDIDSVKEVYDENEETFVCTNDYGSWFKRGDANVIVNNPDKDTAIKIAAERRAKKLAEELGL